MVAKQLSFVISNSSCLTCPQFVSPNANACKFTCTIDHRVITARRPRTTSRRTGLQCCSSSEQTNYSNSDTHKTNDFDQTKGLPPFVAYPFAVPQENVDRWVVDVTDADPSVRLRAVVSCKDLTPERAEPILTKVFDSGESELQNRGFAALFLGYKPNARSYQILSSLVSNKDEADQVRANAVAALGYLRDKRAVPLCLTTLRSDSHWSVVCSSAVSLGMLAEANPDVRPLIFDDLLTVLRETDPNDYSMISACIGALGEVGDSRCVDDILPFVQADDFSLAQCACEALGNIPSENSITVLQKIVEEKTAHVNVLWTAELSLQNIQDALSENRQ